MYCTNCGMNNDDGNKFCIGCGKTLSDDVGKAAENSENTLNNYQCAPDQYPRQSPDQTPAQDQGYNRESAQNQSPNQNYDQEPVQNQNPNQNYNQEPVQNQSPNQNYNQEPVQNQYPNQNYDQEPVQNQYPNQNYNQEPVQNQYQNPNYSQSPIQNQYQNPNAYMHANYVPAQEQKKTSTALIIIIVSIIVIVLAVSTFIIIQAFNPKDNKSSSGKATAESSMSSDDEGDEDDDSGEEDDVVVTSAINSGNDDPGSITTVTEAVTQAATTTVLTENREMVRTSATCPYYYEQKLEVRSNGSYADFTFYEWENNDWKNKWSATGCVGMNGVSKTSSEGDYSTPSGTFDICFCYGLEKPDTKLEFKKLSSNSVWVDDPSSEYYNCLTTSDKIGSGVSRENTYEQFVDGYFSTNIYFNCNGDGVTPGTSTPGKGSVKTLCGYRKSLQPTYGCIDISSSDMSKLLKLLDSKKKPVIIIS